MWGQETAKRANWYSALIACTPSYFTAEGEALNTMKNQSMEDKSRMARLAGWGAGPVDFQEKLEDYAKSDLVGFNVTVVA